MGSIRSKTTRTLPIPIFSNVIEISAKLLHIQEEITISMDGLAVHIQEGITTSMDGLAVNSLIF